MNKYTLASSAWDDSEYEAIQEVVASGMFTMGEHVAEFERSFADYIGAKYCLMVNSGSSANLLMVAALFYRENGRLKRGDEVIVPAVSWSTTYFPLYQYGLKLKFVDIDAETLNYDLLQLQEAVSENTRMIMAVNLLGNPNNYEKITGIIGGNEIIILEDNCESMGARYNDKQAGTFGLMGSFSTFFSHHMSTMEGGMVITDDEEIYHILLALRAHGWTRNLPKVNKVCSPKSDDIFDESFRFVLPGYNLRPLELSGAIGTKQLKKLPGILEVRRNNAVIFQNQMKNYPYLAIQKELGASSWFGFSLVVNSDAPFSRKDVIRELEAQHIECRPIVAGNFARNEVMQWFDYTIHNKLINADHIDSNGLFIGNHHYPLNEQLDALIFALDRLPK